MLVAPDINPVALSLGPIKVHWYGLMYVIGFASVWWLAGRRAQRPGSGWTTDQVADIVVYGALGAILGGRIGYVLFYNLDVYLANPLAILRVWDGGMSFHGGFTGVMLAMWLWGRKQKKTFFEVADFIAPWAPIGLGAGRIGNFINGELWGRLCDPGLPWGMVFRGAGDAPRHPSQVYQFLMEGLLLFVLLWFYARKQGRDYYEGRVSAAFLFGYGIFRFIAEFFREPDAHLGILSLGMSMGQWLCVPMVIGGAWLWFMAQKPAPPVVERAAASGHKGPKG